MMKIKFKYKLDYNVFAVKKNKADVFDMVYST